MSIEDHDLTISFDDSDTIDTKPNLKLIDCAFELDIANYLITNYLKDEWKCTNEKDTFFYFDGVRWKEDKQQKRLYHIITDELKSEVQKLIMITESEYKESGCKDKEIKEKLTRYNYRQLQCSKKKEIGEIIYHLSNRLRDNYFYDKLDTNRNLIGFENGVYDLDKKVFRQGKPSDYLSFSVGIDFPNEEDYGHKQDVLNFFNQVYPNAELKEYMLRQLSQSLSGKQKVQCMHVHTGSGANGKSILCKLMLHSLGDYAISINSSVITQRNNETHTAGNPVLHELKGRRYVYANEAKKKDHLNEQFIKTLTGGDQQKYRLLFSNEMRKFYPQAHLNFFCNKMPTTDGEDGGLSRRLRVVPYLSKFVSQEKVNPEINYFLMDETLETRIVDYKYDFIKLLLNLYDPNYKDNPPKIVLEHTTEYLDENNEVKEFIKNHILITNAKHDYLTMRTIKEVWKGERLSPMKEGDLKKALQQEMPDIVFKEKTKISNKDVRSVFIGIKFVYDDVTFD